VAGAGGFDARVTGADQMEQLGRDLRAAGAKQLRKEFMRAGRELGKPVAEAFKAAALAELPKKGGLNEWTAARMKTKTQIRLSGKDLGVSFITRHKGVKGLSDLKGLNNGKVRYPLFGDTGHWYMHEVPAGFIFRAFEAMGEDVRNEFLAAVDRTIEQLRAEGP
jgi:hypothetical protein